MRLQLVRGSDANHSISAEGERSFMLIRGLVCTEPKNNGTRTSTAMPRNMKAPLMQPANSFRGIWFDTHALMEFIESVGAELVRD